MADEVLDIGITAHPGNLAVPGCNDLDNQVFRIYSDDVAIQLDQVDFIPPPSSQLKRTKPAVDASVTLMNSRQDKLNFLGDIACSSLAYELFKSVNSLPFNNKKHEISGTNTI